MPSLTFVLPHAAYWAGLILFPLIAMYMVRRSRRQRQPEFKSYTHGIAYFIWIIGGFLGLHRFYLRSLLGFIYLPLFFGILVANAEQRDAREIYSDLASQVSLLESRVERYQEKLDEGEERYRDRLERAQDDLAPLRPELETAAEKRQSYDDMGLWLLIAIGALMLYDAASMPRLLRRANERLAAEAEEGDLEIGAAPEEKKDDWAYVSRGWTGVIDRICYYAGEYVAYWSVIAVFVYYYEVVARYVFNSPTNWAHEGMFLMFGMQYLVCGAYAMLTESHVRVDIFYSAMGRRGKAMVDTLTSVFFFIFAGTLLATGYVFAMDATEIQEVSFTEWAIQYWPVKWVIFVGALLLLLQGLSKLAKDLSVLLGPRAVGEEG